MKEYWLVDPDREEVVVNLLNSGRYIAKVYVKGDVTKVSVLEDLYINVPDLFEEVGIACEEERKRMARKLLKAGFSPIRLLRQLKVVQGLVEAEVV